MNVAIRNGTRADIELLLSWFDEAVRWMVARGQPGQWGTEPFSAQPHRVAQVEAFAGGGGLRIAEQDRQPVGALVVGDPPPHVAPVEQRELYIILLLSSRRHAGNRIGETLVRRAIDEARAANISLVRVDCWAGAPRLVRWYEEQGFERDGTFNLNGWIGQVFGMPLS